MYSYTEHGLIKRADGAEIPPDVANRDYRDVLAWVAAGNSIAPWVAPPPSPPAVKEEARRRILARYPDWMQANMTARSHELDRIQSGFMRDENGNRLPARDLDAGELAEENAIRAAWAWIKAIRAKSNEIEALDPIPADYDADARWS